MRKTILDIPIDWLTVDEALRKIAGFVLSNKPHQITTVNPEFIVKSRTNTDFKSALVTADLSLADGTGIILAQTLNDSLPKANVFVRGLGFIIIGLEFLFSPSSFKYQRITGVELSDHIMKRAASEGWRIYLLGGKPGVAHKASELWQKKYAGLNIVGASPNNPNQPETIPNIRATKPDILLVAYGAPKQDIFIAKNKHELKVPVMIGVGGTFDTLAGTKYNPPRWIKALGLEWLVYLFRYPTRIGRIWRATLVFFWTVISSR